ncbi:antibiotic biosynthesis monooxygenase family protein [Bradyrhizobium sp. SRS-191]|uniref:antibiotic biosynthesis monooxygenase family protein n=1 Tax=Bradyrhizobium sp. SRS-191 TaxID=2962606 RepID=UPI00211F04D5|nr:antibiotic biosynthesis monooxygenase family protein [Bradyrhizobium sp. SRS-191]
MSVYVSVTGFRPHPGLVRLLRFWWHTSRAVSQARGAPGNLRVELRPVDGIYHTLTVWRDEASMRAYVGSGAHRRAMTGFRDLGGGRTLGFPADADPGWDTAYARWQREAREV